MSAQTRTGLIAFGVAGTLFLAGCFLTLALVLADRPAVAGSQSAARENTAGGKRADPPTAPVATAKDRDDPDYQAILRHKFFDRKPTGAELEAIIELCLTGNRFHSIYVTATAKYLRNEFPLGDIGRDHYAIGLDPPFVRLDMDRWAARPTRQQVVGALKTKLDEAEFRR